MPNTKTGVFNSRDRCISCGSTDLAEVGGGRFDEEPLRSFIKDDPWGEDPMPVLETERWSLVECRQCTQRFHGLIMSPEWNQIRFSRWMSEEAIRQFEDQHGSGTTSAPQHVQHVLRLQKLGSKRVLDFGCGFGEFLQMCHLFGLEAVGVDRSHARRAGAGVQVFAELDQVSGDFDAITLFEVLEHLDDPLGTLRVLRARLRPGGVLIVEVPDATGTNSISSREEYYKIHPLDHINAFTPNSLERMLGQAGFLPIIKKPAYVTMSVKRLAKDVAKSKLKTRSTQRYFRKSP